MNPWRGQRKAESIGNTLCKKKFHWRFPIVLKCGHMAGRGMGTIFFAVPVGKPIHPRKYWLFLRFSSCILQGVSDVGPEIFRGRCAGL